MTQNIFGAIEAGGTKFICSVGQGDTIIDTIEFPTSDPEGTLDKAANFFMLAAKRDGPLSAIAVGSFGPVQISVNSPDYGLILETPKKLWQGCNIRSELHTRLHLPIFVETDVNCALMGEAIFGAAKGASHVIYLTIGTGIGGGHMQNGHIINGASHPEMGHMFIPQSDHEIAGFAGTCPFHGNKCAEGLASGPALAARINGSLKNCPDDDMVWTIAADHISSLCMNIIMTNMPDKIILGGGVMKRTHLFPMIRSMLWKKINGYLDSSLSRNDIEDLIIPVALNGIAASLGALHFAENMFRESDR